MVVQTRKRKTAALAQPSASTSSETTKRQKLPVRSKGEAAPAQEETASKVTLITFDDDGKADKEWIAPVPTGKTTRQDVSDEESDDDAGPETVSTAKAASDIKKSSQAARKAAQEVAVAEKRKRQERDMVLKKQAVERKKAEEAAATAAVSAALEDQDGDSGDSPPRQQAAAGGRRRIDKAPIPNLLPLEFLTDPSSDDSDEEGPAADSGSRPRKRKVAAVEKSLSRLDRGPGDELVGLTVFRVAAKQDERMAPKLKKQSRNTKEMLLKRNRTAATPRGGFFTKQ
ncbi:U3 snoRNA associated [Drechmeria coniospora]|uniref:U3 snoRNA associated n=1 Tax=Drechmeria coniospora TaxID=98403 RepID=A0A151GKY4_DRECN|nr:U3 snoRNA associated [Drechmeria coniospora]KYK57764.1 U3 snoRNA associated [Drechmeria coniospora]